MFGELLPIGPGAPVELFKKILLVGRRPDCDITLRSTTVSGHHCRLYVSQGYWFVKDLDSSNGTRVNGHPIKEHRLDPGDVVWFANMRYEVAYSPKDLGATGPPPSDEILDTPEDIFSSSLYQRSKSGGTGVWQRGGGSGVGSRGEGSGVKKQADGSGVGKKKGKSGLSGLFRRKSS
jgi:hypothetical protein